jgi:hypothetical protein
MNPHRAGTTAGETGTLSRVISNSLHQDSGAPLMGSRSGYSFIIMPRPPIMC